MSIPRLRLYGPESFDHLFEIREALIEPGHGVAALRAALGFLATLPWSWIEVHASECSADWAEAARGSALNLIVERKSMVPVMKLAPSWDQQRALLRRGTRRALRNVRNVLIRDGITLAYQRETMEVSEAVRTYFDLHRARARYRRGPTHFDYFRSPRARAFFSDAAKAMAAAGHLSISSLRMGERTVATRINLEIAGVVYLYYSGFDVNLWRYSPMTLLVQEIVRDAIERGCRLINLSPGVDQSKTRWPVEYESVIRLSLVRGSLASLAAYRAAAFKRALVDQVRQRLADASIPPIHMLWKLEAPGW